MSRKHHYLPRHYLKGFADDEGSFFVYNKRSGDIFSCSPDGIFFENDLNAVVLPDGNTSDFLEGLYTEIENSSWASFNKVRTSTYCTSIAPLEKMQLFLFLLFLYWRLPSNFESVKMLANKFSSKDNEINYFKFIDEDGNDAPNEVIEKMMSSPAFEKTSKMLVPLAPFFKNINWWRNLEHWRFCYSQDDAKLFLVGDNPIITPCKNDQDIVNCLKEFIFSVSGEILLINSGHSHQMRDLPLELILQYNMAIIDRAKRFVVCPRRDFLESCLKYYSLYVEHGKTEEIVAELFEMLKEGK